MRRRVKFNKEMYVAALDKINVPSNVRMRRMHSI